MKPCKYCRFSETFNEDDDISLLSGDYVEICISKSHGKYWLECEAWGEYGGCHTDYVSIQYCPMCGRKLEVAE